MTGERVQIGMDESEILDLTDSNHQGLVISELQQLKPGESQSYPIKDGFTQGDVGRIGYKSNLGRKDTEGVDLDIVVGEEGIRILFATCTFINSEEQVNI